MYLWAPLTLSLSLSLIACQPRSPAATPTESPTDSPATHASQTTETNTKPSAVPEYKVHNVAQLFEALGSNRRILIAPGTSDLTKLWNPSNAAAASGARMQLPTHPHVQFTNPFDGPQLEIHHIKNQQQIPQTPTARLP